MYPDPFRPGPNILVLTECWMADGTPNKYNYRHEAAKIHEKFADKEPWWGLEQEYTMLDLTERPLGWPVAGFPAPQGPYYCGKNILRVWMWETGVGCSPLLRRPSS